jgi:hypothetical protein
MWDFQVSGDRDTQVVIGLLWPWLGPTKREQAQTAFARRRAWREGHPHGGPRFRSTCPRGHDLTNPENFVPNGAGKRTCGPCKAERRAE